MKTNRNPQNHAMMVMILSAVLVVAVSSGVAAQSTPLELTVTVSWYLGVQVGVEYRPAPHIGVAADVGTTFFGYEGGFALTYDGYLVLYAFEPGRRFQIDACVGVLNGIIVFGDVGNGKIGGEIPFGVSCRAGYGVTDRVDIFLRLGEALPFYWDDSTFELDDVSFPLGLWPDLALGAQISL